VEKRSLNGLGEIVLHLKAHPRSFPSFKECILGSFSAVKELGLLVHSLQAPEVKFILSETYLGEEGFTKESRQGEDSLSSGADKEEGQEGCEYK